MKITILGSGAPAPSTIRKSAGYLIEIGEELILLDSGPGVMHRLLEAGKRPTQVTHAFYSHLHYDHFFDYPLLILQRWDMGAGRIPELKAFGPAPIATITVKTAASYSVVASTSEASVPAAAAAYFARRSARFGTGIENDSTFRAPAQSTTSSASASDAVSTKTSHPGAVSATLAPAFASAIAAPAFGGMGTSRSAAT